MNPVVGQLIIAVWFSGMIIGFVVSWISGRKVNKMSYISDYKCGAMTDEEYRGHCVRVNRQEREWVDEWEKLEEESEDEEDEH